MKIENPQTTKLKTMLNNQRNLIAAKEQEVEDVRKLYDMKKESERLVGQKDVIEIKDFNQKEVLDAVEQKTVRLEELQNSLKSDSDRLTKERAILAEQRQLDRDATRIFNSIEQDRVIQEGLEQTRQIQDSTNQEVAKIQKQSDYDIQKIAYDTKRKADSQSRTYDTTLADRSREQTIQLTTKEIEHNQKLNTLKNEFAKDSRQVSRLNQTEKINKEQNYLKDLKSTEDHYNELLTSKRKQFEQKFQTLQKQHDEVISRTEEQLRSQLRSISSDYAQKRDATLARKEDPFYHLKEINHRLEDKPDSYLVHIDVPEHEAESIVFTGNDRNIKLTLSRRFDDRVEEESGHVNVNKRSESFTKEFKVADIVDPKEVSKKYEDGVLTYRIAKA